MLLAFRITEKDGRKDVRRERWKGGREEGFNQLHWKIVIFFFYKKETLYV